MPNTEKNTLLRRKIASKQRYSEPLNLTLSDELLKGEIFDTLQDARALIEGWRWQEYPGRSGETMQNPNIVTFLVLSLFFYSTVHAQADMQVIEMERQLEPAASSPVSPVSPVSPRDKMKDGSSRAGKPQTPKNVQKIPHLKNPTTYKDKGTTGVSDLTCSVPSTQNFANGVTIKVQNIGQYASPAIVVGFGQKGKIKKNDPSTWLGSKRTEGIVYPGQWIYVTVPWQIHTIGGPDTLVAIVDLKNEAQETNEGNNKSNSFKLSDAPLAGAFLPATPSDAMEGFLVNTDIMDGKKKKPGDDVVAHWSLKPYPKTPENLVKYDPKRIGSTVMLTVRDGANKPVLQIVPDAPINISEWGWAIPNGIPDGMYTIRVDSVTGLFWGTSKAFRIESPNFSQAKLKGTGPSAFKAEKHDLSQGGFSSVMNQPHITQHHAPMTIHGRTKPPGPGVHIPGLMDLPMSIHWKDQDGDLAKGKYRFFYSGVSHGGKGDTGWKNLSELGLGNAFSGTTGTAEIPPFVINTATSEVETISYVFTLSDAAGHKSNSAGGMVQCIPE